MRMCAHTCDYENKSLPGGLLQTKAAALPLQSVGRLVAGGTRSQKQARACPPCLVEAGNLTAIVPLPKDACLVVAAPGASKQKRPCGSRALPLRSRERAGA